MADSQIMTEQDVDTLMEQSTVKKLAREVKEYQRIYRRAILNVGGILLIGIGIVSWPQLSRMVSDGVEETIVLASIFAGVIAVVSVLQSNIHRIQQYRQGVKPDSFNNFFRL